MSKLEKNPEVLASTQDEALCHCNDWKGILRGPSHLKWCLTFLKQHEQVPIETREQPCLSCRN